MSCLRAVNPLFWLSVASSARATRTTGGRGRRRARDDAAGVPAAAVMVNGTGSGRKWNNENSSFPKSR
ncbi:hypothetical protein CVS37_26870 [Burkholderia lata]|nr:hypothetical protein CVS37_26870 [Burkholderia lata]